MGNLRSVLDELRSEDLPGLSDPQLEEDFAELQRAADVIEGERLRRLGELDRRRPFQRDGYLSTTSWLANRFGVSGGRAADQVRLARALSQMPATRQAIAGGEISCSACACSLPPRRLIPRRSHSTRTCSSTRPGP